MRLSSLKSRLTLLCIALVGLIWGAAALLTWHEARHEAEELFDAHLIQAASLLIAQTQADHDEDDEASEHAQSLHRYVRRVIFQVWSGNSLLLRSPNAPETPLSPVHEGLSESRIDGEGWRIYASQNVQNGRLIQVGERISAREEMADAVARGMLGPLLLALPALALLIWLAVRHGLQALDRIADELAQRAPEHLAPLSSPQPLPDELQPLQNQINALFKRVEDNLEKERRFTADAAHELRTPLAALRAQAEIALNGDDETGRRQALQRVIQAADRQAHLVAQLLLLARVDSLLQLELESFDCVALARDLLAELAPAALDKPIELVLEGETELWMRGNPSWLGILLRNLIDNAVRYSPPGCQVHLRIEKIGDKGRIVVEDNGPGLSASELACLEQRFWRKLDPTPGMPVAEGCGLGLSIVRRIANLHGASLSYFSRTAESAGLRVELAIPQTSATRPRENDKTQD